MDSGVATRPITDFVAYHDKLMQFVYHSGMTMRPVFRAAKENPKRVVYAEGEDDRVLRAIQVVTDEGLAKPILIGRPAAVEKRIETMKLRISRGTHFEIVDPEDDARYGQAYREYHALAQRKGVSLDEAKLQLRRSATVIGAMLVRRGDADAMLCGTVGGFASHLKHVSSIIGMRTGAKSMFAMNMLMLPERTLFICDTYVNPDPTAEQIADMTLLAADEVRRFGLVPRVALLSHSSFGSADTPSAIKLREALELIISRAPSLEVEGEMHGDEALSKSVLDHVFPNSRLKGEANIVIMPTLDAANISFNLLKAASGGGITVGPILLGAAKPVHILTPKSTVRRLVNMTALAVVQAVAQG